MEEEIKETSSPILDSLVDQIPNEWVLPFLNNRAKEIYLSRPIIDPLEKSTVTITDSEGIKYPAQFLQGIIEAPATAIINFPIYVGKFARLFNKGCKLNAFAHGMICPMSTMRLTSFDTRSQTHCGLVDGKWTRTWLRMPTTEEAEEVINYDPEFIIQKYMMMIYSFPSKFIIDKANGDISYRNMVKIMNEELGLEQGFYQEGEMPSNTLTFWDSLP